MSVIRVFSEDVLVVGDLLKVCSFSFVGACFFLALVNLRSALVIYFPSVTL